MTGRTILSFSAAILSVIGVAGLFAPDEIAAALTPSAPGALPVFIQLAASGVLGFALLDWMSRGNRIGGIYARPIGLANLLFFSTAALSVGKALSSGPIPASGVALVVIFAVLALCFAWLVFVHDPLSAPESAPPPVRSPGD